MSSSDKHEVNIAWNNCFRKIFNACWRESAKPLLFFCNTLPVSLLVDQRKILFFYKKTASSCNIVLGAMYNNLQKLASTYAISSPNAGNTDIKMAIWCHFTSSFTL